MGFKGYKGFDKNLCYRDFQNQIGKTHKYYGEIEIGKSGFNFYETVVGIYAHCFIQDLRICEVEAQGDIKRSGDNLVTNEIKIIRELDKNEILALLNLGNKNAGHYNSGDWNIGNSNSGDWNVGKFNSGSWNAGNYNAGDFNAGNYNSGLENRGDWNVGNGNSGDGNIGHGNSGDGNTGNRNSGGFNAGIQNTGYFNSGDCNTGNFNSGNFCVGDFNTESCYRIFNTPVSEKEYMAFKAHKGYKVLVCFSLFSYSIKRKDKKREVKSFSYKESWKIFWSTLSLQERYLVYQLPFLKKDIFFEITGIQLHEKILEKKGGKNE